MLHTLLIGVAIVVGVIVALLVIAFLGCLYYACVLARAETIKAQTGCTDEEAVARALHEVSANASTIQNPNGLQFG